MLRFREFLNEAAKYGASGADWEMIICVAYNLAGKTTDEENIAQAIKDAKIVTAKWNKLMKKVTKAKSNQDEVLKIATGISKFVPIGSTMIHYGASNAPASTKWNGYFADVRRMEVSADGTIAKKMPYTTRTPKTDMYLESGDRISLKKKGGSQLMSGKDIETWGVVNVGFDAVEKYEFKDAISETVRKKLDKARENIEDAIIKKDVKRTKEGGASKQSSSKFAGPFTNIAEPTQARKDKEKEKANSKELKGVLPHIDFSGDGAVGKTGFGAAGDAFLKWVAEQINMQEVIQDSIKTAWDDPEVGEVFKEAMVREAMTGEVKFGKGERAVATDILVFDENKPSNSKWHTIDSTHVKDVAKKTDFNVSFKTSGTGKTAWSGLKLIYQDAKKKVVEEMGLLSEEELLSEGMILNFLKRWIRKIFDKIVEIAKKSYEKLLEIFNITPVIKVSSTYRY